MNETFNYLFTLRSKKGNLFARVAITEMILVTWWNIRYGSKTWGQRWPSTCVQSSSTQLNSSSSNASNHPSLARIEAIDQKSSWACRCWQFRILSLRRWWSCRRHPPLEISFPCYVHLLITPIPTTVWKIPTQNTFFDLYSLNIL